MNIRETERGLNVIGVAVFLLAALATLPGCRGCRNVQSPEDLEREQARREQAGAEALVEAQSDFVFRSSQGKDVLLSKQEEEKLRSFPERPGERIDSVEYHEILSSMDHGDYGDALRRIENLARQYANGSREREVLNYMEAECLFFNKDLSSALTAYRLFLEQYPKSPMAENARAAIDFISGIPAYKKMYVSPLEDQADRRRR